MGCFYGSTVARIRGRVFGHDPDSVSAYPKFTVMLQITERISH
jgi:hypothetical protein